MEPQLSINLLGSPAVLLDGKPVRGFVSSKAAALLYYLAATGREHAREALAGLLWGSATDAQAAKNLRDVLSNLRRLLDPYLSITRQTVALSPAADDSVDCRRFAAHVIDGEQAPPEAGAARLREAVAMYQGDFLEGFYVSDAPEFEEWALVERERQRQLLLRALHQLAAYAAEQGSYPQGASYAARLLALEPTREEAHRQLMLLLALSGQRGAALAQYEACRRVLSDELGIDPDEQTEQLYRRILDGTLRPEAQAPSATRQPEQPLLIASAHISIPTPLGPFIGRDAELAQVLGWLRDPESRLVTIAGMGGAGKTRLALQAARELAPLSQQGQLFAHGIAFVALAAVEANGWHDAAAETAMLPVLAARVADALGFAFSGPEAPHAQLTNYLREKDQLLVLDNCEHLPSIAAFAVELLQHAPRLKILATSRVRLNMRGEQVVELDGLAFPRDRQPTTDDRRPATGHEPISTGQELLDKRYEATRNTSRVSDRVSPVSPAVDLESYSALKLFQRTAQTVSPRFAWTSAATDAAIRICALVDGLPLGIELAASLVRLLPCEEIAREIEANLGFLQHTHRDLPERHQSLRAVFDHSWQLLSAAEQRALRQLSVFRGGFSRDAAAQVAGAPLALLASLVDNSLVRQAAEPESATARYELLELVRQYAAEQLAEARERGGADPAALFDRHCHYYLTFLQQRTDDLRGARQQAALAEIHQEIENIRGAWRRAVDQGYAAIVGQAAEGLFHFYYMRSWFQEGAEVFGQAAARFAEIAADDPGPKHQLVWGKLLARQGWFIFHLGRQDEARALLERSLAALRPLGVADELAFPLNYLAAVASYLGDYTAARQLCEEGLAISQAHGDNYNVAVGTTLLGQIAAMLGDYAAAQRYCQASLAIDRAAGHRWGMAFSLLTLGDVAYRLGDYRESFARFREALEIRESLRDARGMALCLNHLGDAAAAQGDHAEAGRRYQAGLALFKEIGNQWGAAASLTGLGYNALALGDADAARSHFRAALRASWDSQAIPRALEALAGMALALAGERPAQARALAELVWGHPAATHEGRDRAGELLARLGDDVGGEPPAEDSLDAVVAGLLAEAG